MANIGSLVADLELNSAEFINNLKRAESQTKSFATKTNRNLSRMEQSWKRHSKQIGDIRKRYLNLRTAIGTLAGSAGLGLLINRSIDAADSIAKTADKIGLSTKSLQEYRYMAERSGVETRALDMGMQRFTRRLAEAAQGGGELKGILEQYSIAVRGANGNIRSTDDVLRDLADAMQGAESDSERLRMAFKAFDSEGAALVNMLKDGSSGIDQLRARYKRLGLEIDESLLRKAESARDSIDDLSAVIKNSLTRMVLSLAPEIGKAADNMAGWVGQNKEFLTQDVPRHIRDMAGSISGFVNSKEFQLISEYWELMAGAAIGFRFGGGIGALVGAGAGGYWSAYKDIKEYIGQGGKVSEEARELKKLVEEYESLNKRILEFRRAQTEGTKLTSAQTDALNDMIDRRKEVTKEIALQRESMKQVADQSKKTGEETVHQLDDVIVTAEAVSKSFYAWDANLANVPPHIGKITDEAKALKSEARGIFEATRKPVEGLYSDLERLQEMYEKGEITQETYWRAIAMYGEKYTADFVKNTEDAAEEVSVFWEQAMRNVQDTWGALFGDILKGELDDFEDYFKAFADALADTMAQAAASMVTNWIKSLGQMKAASKATDMGGSAVSGGGGKLTEGLGGLVKGVGGAGPAIGYAAFAAIAVGVIDAVAGGSAVKDLIKGKDSAYDREIKAIRKLAAAVTQQTEATKYNTQQLIAMSGEKYSQATLRARLEDPFFNRQIQGKYAVGEAFSFPGSAENFAGMANWQEWESNFRNIFEGLDIDEFYGLMEALSSGNMQPLWDLIPDLKDQMDQWRAEAADIAGDISIDDIISGLPPEELFASTLEGFWESFGEKNSELAKLAMADMEQLFAELAQEATQIVFSLEDSLDSWAVSLDTFRGKTSEYQQMRDRYDKEIKQQEEYFQKISDIYGVEIPPEVLEKYEQLQEEIKELGIAIDEHFLQKIKTSFEDTIRNAGMTDYQKALYDLRQEYIEHRDGLIELGQMYDENGNLTDVAAQGLRAFNTEVQDLTTSLLNSIAKQRAQMFGDESYMESYYRRTYGVMPDKQTIKSQWDFAMSATDEAILGWAEELGVDASTYLTDLGNAHEYYFGEVEEGTDVVNQAGNAMNAYNEALREQAQILQDQIRNYESVQGVIDSILGGEQGGPTSVEFMQRRYQEMLEGAQTNPEQIGAFTSFVQSKFLPFMQNYGGYGAVQDSVLNDLNNLQEDIAGEKTLTDLYTELAKINEELERITTNTGNTVTAVQQSGGGAIMPGIDQQALSRTINPIVDFYDEINSIAKLRQTYSAAIHEGTLDSVLRQVAADIGVPVNTLLGDLQSYFGFATGGTISGPSSGYTVPTTFHGTEHIIPEGQMGKVVADAIKEIGAQTGGQSGPIHITLQVDRRQIGKVVIDEAKHNPEFGRQMTKQLKVA